MSEHEIHLAGGEIDTHFHALHIQNREVDVAGLLRQCMASGLQACIDVGTSETDIEDRYQLLSGIPGVYFAHGLYPSNADREDGDSALQVLEEALALPRTVALGEIGIDRYRDYATPELQRELLLHQVELANRHSLPVIIHNRDAEDELLSAFAECAPTCESVMHCYSGPASFVPRFLDLGFSFSFGGNVTFKNAPTVREAMQAVPLDRLMLETDAPYLAPHPRRGRTNHPGLIGYTYDLVAGQRGIARDVLVASATENAKRVFGI